MRAHKLYRAISAAVLLALSTQTLAQTQVSTTQYAYDAVGNLTQITDPRGLVTTFAYDALGRRSQVQGPPATPGGAVPTVVFNYDGQDRVRQVTDLRSLVTAYTIDGLGNTTQQQSPDTGITNATYDAVGNLTSRTDARGKTTKYRYDALDRLIRADYAGGTPTVFEYDGGANSQPTDIGELTRITDESGSTRLQYDGFGNLLQKTQTTTANGVAKDQTVAYAYGTSGSSNGKRISQTYPSGNVIGTSYDSAGHIAGLTLTTANGSTTLLSKIQYQPFGKPIGWTWGNGTPYTRSFDLSGRLAQFPLGATSGNGTTPNGLSRTVTYDAASRITGYTHTDTSGSTGSSTATAANQTFGYDDQDRLISYLPANSSQSYSYDANGNRTGQTIGGNSYTQTVDPASNRLTASTGPAATRNSYDAVGNQTSDGTTTYSYSDRGRLASVTKSGITTSYLYNGLGQRVVKSGSNVPTGATRYVYDGAGHLLGEYDQSGNVLQETVYLGDMPVATIKNGTTYYVYADQIDTPRVITDTNNLMVWRWDQTDPFGATLPDENPTSLGSFTYNLRFPGQVYDAETGKHYNANRDYDPAGGRYVQSDPIGLNGGQPSTYAYVDGNPTSYADPLGLTPAGAAVGSRIGGWVGGAIGEVIDPVGGGVPGAAIGSALGSAAGDWISDAIASHSQDSNTSNSTDTGKVCKPAKPDVQPNDLCEQLALAEAKAGAGYPIMGQMGDEPRLVALYGPGPWIKKQHTHICPNGRKVVIHYFSNNRGKNVELKFK
ncbi:RHS repeat-associated core domain-containing protein [Ralstonia solanacearum]|uniref:Type IV secretion protein Rhs n=1 Tax=Ralstonia solanacearum TaxID=305 RepID=A0AAD0S6M4_RALSL|nr:RHS repeat-associated core domain-containing protein [Ralstonia solanacearum]AXV81098.1 type IV secretion protein Rhs [Ralstonia solanacearum]AXW52240.1 type IV secretion protein Rhs [Ralstonia solanacearum]